MFFLHVNYLLSYFSNNTGWNLQFQTGTRNAIVNTQFEFHAPLVKQLDCNIAPMKKLNSKPRMVLLLQKNFQRRQHKESVFGR